MRGCMIRLTQNERTEMMTLNPVRQDGPRNHTRLEQLHRSLLSNFMRPYVSQSPFVPSYG